MDLPVPFFPCPFLSVVNVSRIACSLASFCFRGLILAAPGSGIIFSIACTANWRYIVHIMTTVQEIEQAIDQLPSDQFSKIHDWIIEKDWKRWDRQIEQDSASGKLAFLVKEALQDAESGDTRSL